MDKGGGAAHEIRSLGHWHRSMSAWRPRTFLFGILAIIAVAIALGVTTIAFLEVEVVPPDIGTCGVVLTQIVVPHSNEKIWASSTICSKALAPAVQQAEIAFWITVGFTALSIPTIIALTVKRRQAVIAALAAAGKAVTPWRVRLHIAPIGWVGLGLSILAMVLLFISLQWVGDSIEYAGSHEPLDAKLATLPVLATAVLIPAAIAVNSFAGTRGLGNRLVGILGGLILLSPFFYEAVDALLLPLQYV
jgi:hypothetical protein